MDLLFTDALKLQRPNAFTIMVKPSGPSCNLNCTYCYYLEKRKLYGGKKAFRLEESLLKNFIRQYIDSLQLPTVTFVWQGGEPTLLGLDYFRKVTVNHDIDTILGSNIYKALEIRKAKRQSIIRSTAMQKAIAERENALAEKSENQ